MSTDRGINKKLYIYARKYYSAIKKNEIMSFAATWLNLEVTILSKDRERQLPYDITRVKSNSKMTQMNLF